MKIGLIFNRTCTCFTFENVVRNVDTLSNAIVIVEVLEFVAAHI